MPKITKVFELDVTPEIFVNRCSPSELVELEFLMSTSQIQNKIQSYAQKMEKLNS